MCPPLSEKEAGMGLERVEEPVDAGLKVEGSVRPEGLDGRIRGHTANQERNAARLTRVADADALTCRGG